MQLLFLVVASVLTLVVATSAWAMTSYVSSSLTRVNADTTGTPSSGPVNILVVGIDTRGGLTRHQELQLHVGDAISTNTDTMMLIHIPANHSRIEVVSLPRDSWVNLPGHGMNKINAAYGIGGPALMVKTVEQATGLVVNDYVEINFLGFVKVINALGGVNVCLPFAVNDHDSGLHLSAGRHHVNGVQALAFVRDRHSFALSDITRISDQQQLVSSLVNEITSAGVLANPLKLQSVLSSISGAITVDKGFNLIQLADELRGIRTSDVTFTTVPLASINYETPTRQSAVLWDKPAADALFTALRNDTGLPIKHHRHAHSHAPSPSPSPSADVTSHPAHAVTTQHASGPSRAQLSIDIYNGTEIHGLSRRTGTQLARLGFGVHKDGLNWRQHNISQTIIEYPPSQKAAAELLHTSLRGAILRAVTGLTRIRVVLGTHGDTVTGTPATKAPAQTTPTSTVGLIPSTGQAHSAAQDVCR